MRRRVLTHSDINAANIPAKHLAAVNLGLLHDALRKLVEKWGADDSVPALLRRQLAELTAPLIK